MGFFVCGGYGLIWAMQNNHASIVNGSFNSSISPLDRGLAYGDGVFRTLKVINGFPEHWPLHYQMLVANCTAIGIVCPSADVFVSDFEQLFFPEEDAVAKIIITRGTGARGYAPPAVVDPTRILIKSKLPQYPQQHFDEGVKLHLCETRLTLQPKLAGVKHLNRMENVLARMEWNDPEIAEGLMLDAEGNVIECVASNIFAQFDKTLVTPDLSQCGVAGVTRQRILSLAKNIGFETRVDRLDVERLLSADGLIICNSLYGVWQVRELADKHWSKQPLDTDIRKVLTT